MSAEEKTRGQRQKLSKSKMDTNSLRKIKTNMEGRKAFLSARRSAEICLSRKTKVKNSLEFSSTKIQKSIRGDPLGLPQHKTLQSRETFVYTQGSYAN